MIRKIGFIVFLIAVIFSVKTFIRVHEIQREMDFYESQYIPPKKCDLDGMVKNTKSYSNTVFSEICIDYDKYLIYASLNGKVLVSNFTYDKWDTVNLQNVHFTED